MWERARTEAIHKAVAQIIWSSTINYYKILSLTNDRTVGINFIQVNIELLRSIFDRFFESIFSVAWPITSIPFCWFMRDDDNTGITMHSKYNALLGVKIGGKNMHVHNALTTVIVHAQPVQSYISRSKLDK